MALSRRVVRNEVSNLLTYLLESEIALLTTPVLDDGPRLSWRPLGRTAEFLPSRDHGSLALYRAWLEDGQYSALLYDGSLLQITYEFAGTVLVAHRLAWVPCPFAIDPELLEIAPVLDVFDMYAAGATSDVLLRTAVRFDFDLERASPGHPASHMTINASDCRIACAAPLRLGHFIDFVFGNFYRPLWLLHPYLTTISKKAWGSHTATADEVERMHMSWRR